MFDRYVFGVQSYLLTFGVWKVFGIPSQNCLEKTSPLLLDVPLGLFPPKNPWTLQWKGLNLYDAGVRVLKIAGFEGPMILTWRIIPLSKWLITMVSKSPK